MKQILRLGTVLALMGISIATFAQKPTIIFNELEYDFGTFKESDGNQTTTFTFTNKGDVPLILNNVRASCGCTTPKWTRKPVAPGKTGEIQVSYNPKNRPGGFNKSVMVSSNAENGTTVLRIKGRVKEGEKTLAELYPRKIGKLRVKTNHVSFSQMKENDRETKELEVVNDTDKPIEIGFRRVPDHLEVTAEPKNIPAKGKGKLKIIYDAKKANTYGFTSNRIYLSIDGSNDYRASVGVSATIEEDFSHLTADELASAPVVNFSEMKYDFGEMRQGEKKDHTFMLSNEGKSDLIIRNIRSSCGCTAVAPGKKVIPPGETAPVKVTFNSRGKRGRQSKSITVITNDPKTPTNRLRISCNIITGS